MKLPMQAAPVQRGLSRAHAGQSLAQQSCNVFKCAEKVVSCAASCIPDPLTPGCISCLGPLWDTCKSCF